MSTIEMGAIRGFAIKGEMQNNLNSFHNNPEEFGYSNSRPFREIWPK